MSKATTGGSITRTGSAGTSHHRHDPITVGLRLPDGEPLAITHEPEPNRFTPRQREVLALVARGLSNAEIATALSISRRTVEKHVEAIHMKAGTTTRARLVVFAAKNT